jgi:hypothetical protein
MPAIDAVDGSPPIRQPLGVGKMEESHGSNCDNRIGLGEVCFSGSRRKADADQRAAINLVSRLFRCRQSVTRHLDQRPERAASAHWGMVKIAPCSRVAPCSRFIAEREICRSS